MQKKKIIMYGASMHLHISNKTQAISMLSSLHVRSRQSLNRFEPSLEIWFQVVLDFRRFGFIPKFPPFQGCKYRCFYCSRFIGVIPTFALVFFFADLLTFER